MDSNAEITLTYKSEDQHTLSTLQYLTEAHAKKIIYNNEDNGSIQVKSTQNTCHITLNNFIEPQNLPDKQKIRYFFERLSSAIQNYNAANDPLQSYDTEITTTNVNGNDFADDFRLLTNPPETPEVIIAEGFFERLYRTWISEPWDSFLSALSGFFGWLRGGATEHREGDPTRTLQSDTAELPRENGRTNDNRLFVIPTSTNIDNQLGDTVVTELDDLYTSSRGGSTLTQPISAAEGHDHNNEHGAGLNVSPVGDSTSTNHVPPPPKKPPPPPPKPAVTPTPPPQEPAVTPTLTPQEPAAISFFNPKAFWKRACGTVMTTNKVVRHISSQQAERLARINDKTRDIEATLEALIQSPSVDQQLKTDFELFKAQKEELLAHITVSKTVRQPSAAIAATTTRSAIASSNPTLIAAIKCGAQTLKPVETNDKRMKPYSPSTDANGMMALLQKSMDQRRRVIDDDTFESDSDDNEWLDEDENTSSSNLRT